MDYKTALKILGLTSNSSTKKEINKAYRNLSKKYHPDVTRTEDDHLFKLVSESYEFLIDSAVEEKENNRQNFNPSELRHQIDKTTNEILSLVLSEVYENAVVYIVEEWFNNNSPISQLNDAIDYEFKRKWSQLSPQINYKIQSITKDYSDEMTSYTDSKNIGIDASVLSQNISDSITNIIGVITATIAAMISGGAGTAMIASGPFGLIAGAGIGAYLFMNGKKTIKNEVNNFIMDKSLPVMAKSFFKEKVLRELSGVRDKFRYEFEQSLKHNFDKVYDQILKLDK